MNPREFSNPLSFLQALSCGWHFSFKGTASTTIGWIAIKFGTDVHVPQRMNPHDPLLISDLLVKFWPAPLEGQNLTHSMKQKYLYIIRCISTKRCMIPRGWTLLTLVIPFPFVLEWCWHLWFWLKYLDRYCVIHHEIWHTHSRSP